MNIDTLWIMICGCLMFFMQAGFTCFESGSIKTKNIIAVAIENLLTLMIVAIVYFFFGYAIMYGNPSNIALSGITTVYEYSFAFMQIMFAAICITIFGGAMSERTKLTSILIAGAVSALLIYPVFGRWAWYSNGWLNNIGFMDFAGGSVVHLTGGLIALAGIITVGRRKDPDSGKSNIPFAVLGVFILWFGWLAFNGGSCHTFNARVPLVMLNTTIAAAFGMAGALTYRFIFKRRGNYLVAIFDGILGGLAAITACSYYLTPLSSAVIAAIAGAVVMASRQILKRFRIDDAVDAVPDHVAGGLTGLLLLPFFAQPEFIQADTRIMQFGIQLIGVCANIIWVFGIALIMFKLLDKTYGLRVSEEAEDKGLNIAEFEDIYTWENYLEKNNYEEQLSEKNRLLRKQARLLTVTEEQEKSRIRQDLHDGVGQSLAALKVTLGVAKRKENNAALVETAINMTDESIQEMRAILNNLHPPKLEEGLEHAIIALGDEFSKIDGVNCTVESDNELPAFDETVALNIFRVIQEACGNSIKHGEASEIAIRINKNEQSCIFEVKDNGKGFHVADKKFGMGIPSMTDRMRMLGGEFSIYSTIGEGTKVVAEVPYDK